MRLVETTGRLLEFNSAHDARGRFATKGSSAASFGDVHQGFVPGTGASLQGKLTNMRGLNTRPGMNPAYLAEINGKTVFVKGFYNRAERVHELAAEKINDLGGGLVTMPRSAEHTILTSTGRIIPGIVQELVPKDYQKWANRPDWFAKVRTEAKNNVNVFDFVTANEDRHKGNLLVDRQGQIVAIDHGLSFGPTHYYQPREYLLPKDRVPLTDRQKKWLDAVAAPDAVALAQSTGLSVESARWTRERALALRQFGFVPTFEDIGHHARVGSWPSTSTASQQALPTARSGLRFGPNGWEWPLDKTVESIQRSRRARLARGLGG